MSVVATKPIGLLTDATGPPRVLALAAAGLHGLIRGRLWVGGAAAALTWFAAAQLGVSERVLPTLIVLFSTVVIYGADDLFDGARRRWSRHRVTVATLALSGLLLAAPLPAGGLVVAGLVACLAYGAPVVRVRGVRMGLKHVVGVKALFVAVALTTATVALPLLCAGQSLPSDAGILIATLFVVTISNALLFDVCDLAGDRRRGVPTLPILFGERRTRCALIALNGLLLIGVTPVASTAVMVAAVLSLLLCIVRGATATRRSADLVVDGLPYLLAALSAWL